MLPVHMHWDEDRIRAVGFAGSKRGTRVFQLCVTIRPTVCLLAGGGGGAAQELRSQQNRTWPISTTTAAAAAATTAVEQHQRQRTSPVRRMTGWLAGWFS